MLQDQKLPHPQIKPPSVIKIQSPTKHTEKKQKNKLKWWRRWRSSSRGRSEMHLNNRWKFVCLRMMNIGEVGSRDSRSKVCNHKSKIDDDWIIISSFFCFFNLINFFCLVSFFVLMVSCLEIYISSHRRFCMMLNEIIFEEGRNFIIKSRLLEQSNARNLNLKFFNCISHFTNMTEDDGWWLMFRVNFNSMKLINLISSQWAISPYTGTEESYLFYIHQSKLIRGVYF